MTKLINKYTKLGVYGNKLEMMLVDHPSYGRLILIQGYYGTREGIKYSYLYGKAVQLQPHENTSVLNDMWSDNTSNYVAIINGWHERYTLLDIPGYQIEGIAMEAKKDKRFF